jgi:hypothetical protein
VIIPSIFVFGIIDCTNNHLIILSLLGSQALLLGILWRANRSPPPAQIVLQLRMACQHHRKHAAAVPDHLLVA